MYQVYEPRFIPRLDHDHSFAVYIEAIPVETKIQ